MASQSGEVHLMWLSTGRVIDTRDTYNGISSQDEESSNAQSFTLKKLSTNLFKLTAVPESERKWFGFKSGCQVEDLWDAYFEKEEEMKFKMNTTNTAEELANISRIYLCKTLTDANGRPTKDIALAKVKPLDGMKAQFKSMSIDKFLCPKNGGGTLVAANCSEASNKETHVKIWAIPGTNKYLFQVSKEQFFLGLDGDLLVAISEEPGINEAFEIVPENDDFTHVRIKAWNGRFLQAKTGKEDWVKATAPDSSDHGYPDPSVVFSIKIVGIHEPEDKIREVIDKVKEFGSLTRYVIPSALPVHETSVWSELKSQNEEKKISWCYQSGGETLAIRNSSVASNLKTVEIHATPRTGEILLRVSGGLFKPLGCESLKALSRELGITVTSDAFTSDQIDKPTGNFLKKLSDACDARESTVVVETWSKLWAERKPFVFLLSIVGHVKPVTVTPYANLNGYIIQVKSGTQPDPLEEATLEFCEHNNNYKIRASSTNNKWLVNGELEIDFKDGDYTQIRMKLSNGEFLKFQKIIVDVGSKPAPAPERLPVSLGGNRVQLHFTYKSSWKCVTIELWEIIPGANKYFFQASNERHFIGLNSDGLVFISETVGTVHDVFEIIRKDDNSAMIRIKASNGKYIQATKAGFVTIDGLDESEWGEAYPYNFLLTKDGDVTPDSRTKEAIEIAVLHWEPILMIQAIIVPGESEPPAPEPLPMTLGGNRVKLYFSFKSSARKCMTYELWEIIPGTNKYLFRASDGHFIGMRGDHLVFISENKGPTDVFEIIRKDGNSASIQIKAYSNGKYIQATEMGFVTIDGLADASTFVLTLDCPITPDRAIMVAIKHTVQLYWKRITMEYGIKVQLKSAILKTFFSAVEGGETIISANTIQEASDWETFQLLAIKKTNKYLFQTSKGYFMGRHGELLVALSEIPGITETFEIVHNEGDFTRIRLRASNGMFLQAKKEKWVTVDASELTPDATKWNQWGEEDPSIFVLSMIGAVELDKAALITAIESAAQAINQAPPPKHCMPCVLMLGPWGGQGGQGWNIENIDASTGLKEIVIRHGGVIDAIAFKYEKNGNIYEHPTKGGNGGKEEKFTLDKDEFLTSICGYYTPFKGVVVISSLTFFTNTSRKHGPFGKQNGTYFSIPVTKWKIIGFYGRAGTYLDNIGFYAVPN